MGRSNASRQSKPVRPTPLAALAERTPVAVFDNPENKTATAGGRFASREVPGGEPEWQIEVLL